MLTHFMILSFKHLDLMPKTLSGRLSSIFIKSWAYQITSRFKNTYEGSCEIREPFNSNEKVAQGQMNSLVTSE